MPNPKEVILGQDDAPVTVHVYYSLTCPHCAKLITDIVPQIKKHYVDTGKVKIVLHDFARDMFEIKATQFLYCVADDQYLPTLELMFQDQASWVLSQDPLSQLKRLAKIAGMPEKDFDACIKNEATEATIFHARYNAQKKYKISTVPTILFDEKTQPSMSDFESFQKNMDAYLKSKGI